MNHLLLLETVGALARLCRARTALVLTAKKELNPRCFFNSALAERGISSLPAKELGEVFSNKSRSSRCPREGRSLVVISPMMSRLSLE